MHRPRIAAQPAQRAFSAGHTGLHPGSQAWALSPDRSKQQRQHRKALNSNHTEPDRKQDAARVTADTVGQARTLGRTWVSRLRRQDGSPALDWGEFPNTEPTENHREPRSPRRITEPRENHGAQGEPRRTTVRVSVPGHREALPWPAAAAAAGTGSAVSRQLSESDSGASSGQDRALPPRPHKTPVQTLCSLHAR